MDNLLTEQGKFPLILESLSKVQDTSWSSTEETHDHYELVYVKRGSAVLTLEDDSVNLLPGMVVIIKPQYQHSFNIVSFDCEFIVISFSFEETPLSTPAQINFKEQMNKLGWGTLIPLTAGSKNDIQNVFRRLMKVRRLNEVKDDFLVYLLMLELFVYLSRAMLSGRRGKFSSGGMNVSDAMQSAKDYIIKNYDKSICLADVAKHVYLSESYLSHCFKKHFGTSPKNFLMQVRIVAAKDLLVKTDMKTLNVALSVGFLSQQRFNDIFKKTEGITPLQYRKAYKDSVAN